MKHTRHLISLAFAALALVCAADVTRDTEWQDVPPGTRIGTVVDLGGGGVDTNAVRDISGQQITNAVDVGYLCTVAAAQAMTNDATIVRGEFKTYYWNIFVSQARSAVSAERDNKGNEINEIYATKSEVSAAREYTDAATNAIPRIVSGGNEIAANGETVVESPLGEWTPSHTPIPENPKEGDVYYGYPFFDDTWPNWCYRIYTYIEDEGGWFNTQEEPFYEENPDATLLYFPDGTPTRRLLRTRLATTNDVSTSSAQTLSSAKTYADATTNGLSAAAIGAASIEDVQALNAGYTRLYNFSTGATNANFTATNYPPTAAAAAAKLHWQPEPGMDFSDVPASLQLNEKRDGAWRTVMDTRDWTVWYYKFKESTLTNEISRLKAENAALSNRLEAAQAWANRTANGVDNPMTDTLVVDRPNMWLMADYEWQKCVSGSNQCFVIRAKNVALSGGANTNGFLEVCDAFGKPYMRVNKSAETFADPAFSEIYFDDDDGAWYVVFGNQTKPTKGGANCEIVGAASGGGKCILYDEDDPECPATITWPETADSHAGHWIMKAVPKPVGGVVPTLMFFGAEIKVAGKDYVEYIKETSFGAGIRVGNNVYEAVESGNTLIWQKRVD